MSNGETLIIPVSDREDVNVKEVLDIVFDALNEKGYNPVNQLVGFIMSGDPTYITAHKNARTMIMKVERDEILEELVNCYMEKYKK